MSAQTVGEGSSVAAAECFVGAPEVATLFAVISVLGCVSTI